MATIAHVKALIRANFESDDNKFRTIVLQIAAHEAKVGHTASARELKDMVQNPKYFNKGKILKFNKQTEIFEQKIDKYKLEDLIVSKEIEEKIIRVKTEYNKKELLRKNGLMNRSKILLTGNPGTGKTMTASVLANELYLPLYVIQLDRLITKYMGETSVKLRQVFEQIKQVRGVYLFDEFDAIGADRSLDNDVGEMRRILNSFLQNLEEDKSYSIIVAATNNPSLLDKAVFRRFDDVIEYDNPDVNQIIRLIQNRLINRTNKEIFDEEVYDLAMGLNHADIVKACEDAVKYSIMEDVFVTKEILIGFIKDRRKYYNYKEA